MDTLRGAICLNFLFLSGAGKSAFLKRETGGLEAGETEGEERRREGDDDTWKSVEDKTRGVLKICQRPKRG